MEDISKIWRDNPSLLEPVEDDKDFKTNYAKFCRALAIGFDVDPELIDCIANRDVLEIPYEKLYPLHQAVKEGKRNIIARLIIENEHSLLDTDNRGMLPVEYAAGYTEAKYLHAWLTNIMKKTHRTGDVNPEWSY